jgi:hypothetical protein
MPPPVVPAPVDYLVEYPEGTEGLVNGVAKQTGTRSGE